MATIYDIDRLTAELAQVRAERDAARAEVARLTATRPRRRSDTMDRRETARAEMTRDPIFLYQRRIGRDKWHTELVFLTRAEAEEYGKRNEHNARAGWQVYCVPAHGELAQLLNTAPAGGEAK